MTPSEWSFFDQICQTQEYYPFRIEVGLLKQHMGEIVAHLGPNCGIIELGSGASIKSRILLDEIQSPAWYVPVDISPEALSYTQKVFLQDYPNLRVSPICTDFLNLRSLSQKLPKFCHKRVVFFPGSTIGNFEAQDAKAYLSEIAWLVGEGGRLIIGVDLLKDRSVLEAAYNDKEGVTAEFNLNLLRHINREYGGNFNLKHFQHYAGFNEQHTRIEMHLISTVEQWVTVLGQRIHLRQSESIHTENSYKYPSESFEEMAKQAGFRCVKKWISDMNFGVYEFAALGGIS